MNDTTQTGIAMAALAMIGTVVGTVVGYFRDRDKLRHDVQLKALETQNKTQAEQIATQAEQIATQGKRITRLTQISRKRDRKHRECEEQHQATAARLEQIESKLAQKKDASGPHEPLT